MLPVDLDKPALPASTALMLPLRTSKPVTVSLLVSVPGPVMLPLVSVTAPTVSFTPEAKASTAPLLMSTAPVSNSPPPLLICSVPPLTVLPPL